MEVIGEKTVPNWDINKRSATMFYSYFEVQSDGVTVFKDGEMSGFPIFVSESDEIEMGGITMLAEGDGFIFAGMLTRY